MYVHRKSIMKMHSEAIKPLRYKDVISRMTRARLAAGPSAARVRIFPSFPMDNTRTSRTLFSVVVLIVLLLAAFFFAALFLTATASA